MFIEHEVRANADSQPQWPSKAQHNTTHSKTQNNTRHNSAQHSTAQPGSAAQ